MKRLLLLMLAGTLALADVSTRAQSRDQFVPHLIGFDVAEATIYDMQGAMQRGRVTSKELVLQSFARIAFFKTTLQHGTASILARAALTSDWASAAR